MTGRVGDWGLFLLRRCNHFICNPEDAITDASATLSETILNLHDRFLDLQIFALKQQFNARRRES